jgi:hypothetical protein
MQEFFVAFAPLRKRFAFVAPMTTTSACAHHN